MGELWGVFCDDLGENFLLYYGTTLYIQSKSSQLRQEQKEEKMMKYAGDNYMATLYVNTLRPRQNGRHFADDFFLAQFHEWKYLNSD